jgi:acetyl esterase/lipase
MKCVLMGWLVMAGMTVLAAEPEWVTLWPKGAPEPADFQAEPEAEIERDKPDGVKRLGNVSVPMMAIYRPEKPAASKAAVLVCPGGGYNILAIDHEGTQVCEWLNGLGLTAVLLKYRVPRRDRERPHFHPLQDAQRAMGLLRARAEEWGIAPDQIGVLGFSAGGNLSVMLALQGNERQYQVDPAMDSGSAVPNFVVPIYPAYLTSEDGSALLPQIRVTEKAPAICLIHAHNDRITPAGSALLYLEYKKLNLPAELHIYGDGGHGFGMKQNGHAINQWPDRVADWFKQLGLVE